VIVFRTREFNAILQVVQSLRLLSLFSSPSGGRGLSDQYLTTLALEESQVDFGQSSANMSRGATKEAKLCVRRCCLSWGLAFCLSEFRGKVGMVGSSVGMEPFPGRA